jgi:superfamily II DNA or RNA helicase
MHIRGAFQEIQEYANSSDIGDDEIPPDLSKYTGINYANTDEEKVDTASNEELSQLVHTNGNGRNPLDYDYNGIRLQAPAEILNNVDRIESISVDEEVMRFIVNHSVNEIWKKVIVAYETNDNDVINGTIGQITKNGNYYHDEVVNQFMTDYNGTIEIMERLPPGYSFKYQPKIMQAYVAYKMSVTNSFLNLSGVGAGKTLSAILASRVVDSRLTVIVCPNDIIDQWATVIKEAFPDSYVYSSSEDPKKGIGKQVFHIQRDETKRQYLILNYDKFNQDYSPNLILELGKQKIDFVILDEVHKIKIRDSPRRDAVITQRHKHLVGLMTEIRQGNSDIKVLGMTATPVINDLMEGRSLIDVVTGKRYNDVSVNPTIPNANVLYEKLQLMSVREMPNYHVNVDLVNGSSSEVEAYTDDNIVHLVRLPLKLEQVLTEARIPEIIERIKYSNKKTIIYTEYVTGILSLLKEEVRKAGYEHAEYTGLYKELEMFIHGKAQVLIASKPIAVGVDGLQRVCDNLIINMLPWTNAEYQQLVGRLVRIGQSSEKVNVHIIKARLN